MGGSYEKYCSRYGKKQIFDFTILLFCLLPTQGGVEEIPQFFIISSPHRKLYTKNPWILDTQKQRGVAPLLIHSFLSRISPLPPPPPERGSKIIIIWQNVSVSADGGGVGVVVECKCLCARVEQAPSVSTAA